MKKICRTFLILLAPFLVKVNVAQTYIPMAVDSAQWIVILRFEETPAPVDDLWEYYAHGDTLVEGMHYIKIYKRYLEVKQTGPPFSPISEYELTALMRDDIPEKKVYVIPVAGSNYTGCDLGVESLMCDFSLEIGDTVSSCLSGGTLEYPYFIDNIGEIFRFGLNTRRFVIEDLGYFDEGIGSSHGLIEAMFDPVKNVNNNLYRLSLGYYCRNTPCGLIVSTNDQPLPSDFSVYPNPANGEIYVQLPTNIPPSVTKVEVFGANGRLVHKGIPGSNPYVFNAQNLARGFYLVRMWDGMEWLSGKLIRE